MLADAVTATASEPIDVRHLVTTLTDSYPGCGCSAWTAWSARPGDAGPARTWTGDLPGAGRDDPAQRLGDRPEAGRRARRSSKNLGEHELAVASVAEALAPLCSGMNVPESPYVLELPNVLHLATDVTAVAHKKASALRLAAAARRSAAVCGTPTAVARAHDLRARGPGPWSLRRAGRLDRLARGR